MDHIRYTIINEIKRKILDGDDVKTTTICRVYKVCEQTAREYKKAAKHEIEHDKLSNWGNERTGWVEIQDTTPKPVPVDYGNVSFWVIMCLIVWTIFAFIPKGVIAFGVICLIIWVISIFGGTK